MDGAVSFQYRVRQSSPAAGGRRGPPETPRSVLSRIFIAAGPCAAEAEGCPCCTGPLGLPARLCSGGSAGPGGRPRAVGKLLGAEGSLSRSRLCRDPLRSARAYKLSERFGDRRGRAAAASRPPRCRPRGAAGCGGARSGGGAAAGPGGRRK